MNKENNILIKKELVKIAKEAYKKIKNIKKEVSFKGPTDLLTKSDLLVERFIITKLNKFMPDVPIISEEYNFNNEKSKEYFAIDPIDGTINYANGLDIWGIQIAYINDYEEQVAIIYLPKLDKMYYALKGMGAYLNDKKINVSSLTLNAGIVDFGYSKKFKVKNDITEKLSPLTMRLRELGAACYGFSNVAAGNTIGYFVFTTNVWDVDPGYLICKEAGAFTERNNKYTLVANTKVNFDILNDIIKNALNLK